MRVRCVRKSSRMRGNAVAQVVETGGRRSVQSV